MKIIFNFLTCVFLLSVFSNCGGEKDFQKNAKSGSSLFESNAYASLNENSSIINEKFRKAAQIISSTGKIDSLTEEKIESSERILLDEFAELERAGSWVQGIALRESNVRENFGDYAGAVAAAYKELSYAYGRGLIEKQEAVNGIKNVLNVTNEESVVIAGNALLSFLNQNWDDARTGLEMLFGGLADDEPDAFGRWMILVCIMEKKDGISQTERRRAGEAYKSIRSRYVQFPEYWYRGARVFSGAIAAIYAENCINTSIQGPFADECRAILASHSGLKPEDGALIKTKSEIESIITQAINSSNPQLLNSLLPLINLSDNPYTVYAVGALRALNSVSVFKNYFNIQAAAAKGRLAERLSYICRS